jgi:hypothetical protein
MARLKNLVLEEFSIVRGADYKPANPEAVALKYKATPTQKEQPMSKDKAPAAEPKQKSLAGQIAEAVRSVVKATTTRTYDNTYTSNSRSVETVEDSAANADPGTEGTSTVVVITDAVEKASPAQPTAAVQVAKAQPAPEQQAAPQAEAIAESITKAVEAGLNPVAKAVEALDTRLASIENRSVGSQKVKSMPTNLLSVNSNSGDKFPEFTKFLSQVSGLTPGQKLTKATITGSGWSYGLSLAEAGQFIDYVVDESVLMKQVRTIKMPDKKYRIDKIGLGGKVLVKGTGGVDPGDTASVSDPTVVELSAEEVLAIVSVSDDAIEDNIEGDAFVQRLLGMISRSAANELDQAAIHGDTAVADAGILDRWNGFYKLAKAGGAHVIEAMADADRYWPGANGAKATRLLKSLPTKYRQDYRNLGVVLHNDLYLDYMDELSSKGYSEAWQAITGMQDVPIRSIKNVRVPMLKTDMGFTYSATPYTDGTFAMVTDLRNLIVGIHREIRLEPQRFARKRCTDYVLSMRADVKIENPDAIAIYDHAKVK